MARRRAMDTLPDASPDASSSAELIGGRYRIEAELGRGGMGAAFRAFDTARGRVVALKTLTATRDSTQALFEREYQTLASLRHPCVIEVYDYKVAWDGTRFYTMELIEGEDLHALAPVPWRTLAGYLRDAATSLALLHARKLVHRDVSPRNIRVTRNGRAKLLDFGTLAPFGHASDLAGTPSCIAPESLRSLDLDARTDLFSLGVVAYWSLTKRRPYPIREFADAETAWARSPEALSADAPDVPRALEQLILSLLDPEPAGRPASAAEVVDRLTAIAELDDEPLAGVVDSYLTGSAMVGREREQIQLRQHLERAAKGEGHVVAVEGAPGMGASRLTNELSVEARLAGAGTIQIQSLSHGGPGGVLRALVTEVFETAPIEAGEAAVAFPELRDTLDELRSKARPSQMGRRRPFSAAAVEAQARIQLLIVEWVMAVAKIRSLLIVVEDAHAVDASSAGALVVLAHAARRAPLLLVVTRALDADAPLGIQQLSRIAARIKLRRLEPLAVEQLLRTAFGDVPHLARVSGWVSSVAEGNPGQSLELLRHLVDRKIIRYASGAWVLPAELSGLGLPASVEEALASRVANLGPRALALAQFLALHRGALSLSSCRKLMPDLPVLEVGVVAEELKTRQIAAGAGETLRLGQEVLRELLLRDLTEDEKRKRHVALGRALVGAVSGMDRERLQVCTPAELGDALQAGWHLLHGGEDADGRDLLRGAGIELTHRGDGFADAVPALEAALAAYRAQGRSRYECGYLLIPLTLAGAYWDWRLLHRYGDELFETLDEVTGMQRARRLQPWLGAHLALFISIAVAFVQMAVSSRRRLARGYEEALLLLIALSTAVLGACCVLTDSGLATRVSRRLQPLRAFPRGHAVRLMLDFQDGLVHNVQDRYAQGTNVGLSVLREMLRPGGARGIPDDVGAQLEVGVHTLVGFGQSLGDGTGVEATLAALARVRTALSRQTDASIRVSYHLHRGELALFDKYREVVDVLGAQAGSVWRNDILLYRSLWWGSAMCQDILTLKRAATHLEALAEEHPTLAPVRDLAQACYLNERGMAELALSRYGATLEAGAAELTPLATCYAGIYARILRAVGKPEDARRVCEGTLGRLSPDDVALISISHVARVELALALSDLGDTAAAVARLDALAAETHDNPLLHGLTHKARAQVALSVRDKEAFRAHLQAMQDWFRKTDNAALFAQCQRLAEEGRALDPVVRAAGGSPGSASAERDHVSIERAFRACRGADERFQMALDLVVEASGAAHGYLYLLEPEGLRFAAPLVGAEPSGPLFDEVVRVVEAARTDSLETEVFDDVKPGTLVTVVESIDDPELRRARAGAPFRSLLLTVSRGDEVVIVGAVALVEGTEPLQPVHFSRLEEIARCIYEAGDVRTVYQHDPRSSAISPAATTPA